MKRLAAIVGVIVAVMVIAFLLARTPDTDPAEMREKYGAAPSQFVTLPDGRTVHLRDEGPRGAPAIVLLHGSNADLHTWQAWVDGLKSEYRVIRLDQRGHGLTGPAPDGDYRTEAFATDIDAVADALGLQGFVLAGNSMGGAIAARYAMDRPERLTGLVLIDAGGAPVQRDGGGNLAFTLARIPVVNQLAFAIMPRSIIEKSLKQSVARKDIVTPAMADRYWELARYPGNRTATLDRFSLGWQTFTQQQVSAISVPTLVMWGEEDSLIPFAAANWYMERLPSATLVSYPGIGHLPMEEAPQHSLRDLRAWLSGLSPAARSPGAGRDPV